MDKIIFIGGVGAGKIPTNGVMAKNSFLLSSLRRFFSDITIIDTDQWKRCPWVLLHLLWVVALFPNAKYIISANNQSTYRLLRILNYFPHKREIYYWVIGGSIANWIKTKRVKSEPYRILKLFIVEGEVMKQTLAECGFDNVIYVPNFKNISYLPNKKQSTGDVLHFVFLSRIMPEKGCDEIMKATKILNSEGVNDLFQVDFWGKIEDSYAESFKQQIMAIPNVNYKGFLDLRNVENYDILSRYDTMLFPTSWHGEGFPGIVIDAYIAGLPVIATEWSLNGDVLKDGETGIFIPVHDVGALADAMRRIITDRSILEPMSRKCQQMAKLYDSETILTEELFTKMGICRL